MEEESKFEVELQHFCQGSKGKMGRRLNMIEASNSPPKGWCQNRFFETSMFVFWFWYVLASFSNLLLIANGRLVRFKFWYSKKCGQVMSNCQNRWWFQIFLIFTPTWGKDPIWLRSFKWVPPTIEICLLNFCIRNICWLTICQKSQTTTKDDDYPIIYRVLNVLTIPSGCEMGFLKHQPSPLRQVGRNGTWGFQPLGENKLESGRPNKF